MAGLWNHLGADERLDQRCDMKHVLLWQQYLIMLGIVEKDWAIDCRQPLLVERYALRRHDKGGPDSRIIRFAPARECFLQGCRIVLLTHAGRQCRKLLDEAACIPVARVTLTVAYKSIEARHSAHQQQAGVAARRETRNTDAVSVNQILPARIVEQHADRG